MEAVGKGAKQGLFLYLVYRIVLFLQGAMENKWVKVLKITGQLQKAVVFSGGICYNECMIWWEIIKGKTVATKKFWEAIE